MPCLYITFDSHFHALAAKKNLGQGHFLAPTPRVISSSCASCLGCELPQDYDNSAINYKKYLDFDGVEGVYILSDGKKIVLYEI